MSFSTCPLATVNAPVERVWALLEDPAQFGVWWEAKTRSIVPPGPAQPGQEIYAQLGWLPRRWDLHITVQSVAPEKHQLDLHTRLPFGITVYNHITCAGLDDRHTRLSFG